MTDERTFQADADAARRQLPRASTDGLVYISVGQIRDLPAKLVNVGEGGMCVLAPDLLNTRDVMSLRFSLPGNTEVLSAQAMLTWSKSDGHAGVHFVEMPEPVLDRVRSWIRERIAGI